MRKPVNVIPIIVANGANGRLESETLDDGKIIGMSIFWNDLNNTGFVQASLDCNGAEILPLHPIENFRNRETEYKKGFIPLNEDGGKKYTVNIVSDQAFSAETSFGAVFYYDLENRDC